MSQRPQNLFPDEEEASAKLKRKSKESPFMVGGLAALASVLGYSIYKFKNRGDMKTSVYLIHTRVLAQGAVVSALALGVAYSMFDRYYMHPENDKDEK